MSALQSRVCVVGAGVYGIITATILKRDGFQNVQVFCLETAPGGTWSRERCYPNLTTNGIYHEFQLAGQHYTSEELQLALGNERIAGPAVANYLERFVSDHLDGSIRYSVSVENISRPADNQGWTIHLRDTLTGQDSTERFDKVVVATGDQFRPWIPPGLQETRQRFRGPCVHTSSLATTHKEVLAAVPVKSDADKESAVLVVGAGKSANDAATYFARQNRRVVLVMRESLWPIPASHHRKLPSCIRRSRFISLFLPSLQLHGHLEQLLHNTRFGSWLIRFANRKAAANVLKQFAIADEPWAPRTSTLWGARNAGPIDKRDHEGSWISRVKSGDIEVLAKVKAVAFEQDGRSVRFDDGTSVRAAAVVLGTGFCSSVRPLFDDMTRREIGLDAAEPRRYPAVPKYPILDHAPSLIDVEPQVMQLVRGMTIYTIERSQVVCGFQRNFNHFYLAEGSAHWIASYFRADPFFSIKTMQQAEELASADMAWLLARYPTRDCLVRGSPAGPCNSGDALSGVHAAVDTLLLDMGLEPRSTAKGFWWFLKTVSQDHLATLTEERQRRRQEYPM